MWFNKLLWELFKRNSICDKCGSPSKGNLFCERCKEYLDNIERKNKEEENAKKELRRRNWIKKREEFLNDKDG